MQVRRDYCKDLRHSIDWVFKAIMFGSCVSSRRGRLFERFFLYTIWRLEDIWRTIMFDRLILPPRYNVVVLKASTIVQALVKKGAFFTTALFFRTLKCQNPISSWGICFSIEGKMWWLGKWEYMKSYIFLRLSPKPWPLKFLYPFFIHFFAHR